MEQRIHSSKSSRLTYWHYLSHFKWALLGLFSIIIFLIFTQLNKTSMVSRFSNAESVEINVIYPTDIVNKKTSIKDYFTNKDRLKITDDIQAMEKNFKTVIPLDIDRSQSRSYVILEYTKVFGRPKFCSLTNEEIFGRFCPYTNW